MRKAPSQAPHALKTACLQLATRYLCETPAFDENAGCQGSLEQNFFSISSIWWRGGQPVRSGPRLLSVTAPAAQGRGCGAGNSWRRRGWCGEATRPPEPAFKAEAACSFLQGSKGRRKPHLPGYYFQLRLDEWETREQFRRPQARQIPAAHRHGQGTAGTLCGTVCPASLDGLCTPAPFKLTVAVLLARWQ